MVDSSSCPKVQLFISCRKLRDTDVFSKSDPFVEFFEKGKDNKWSRLGITEVVENNLNPDFITNFEISYYFEEQQHLKFVVYDSDNGRPEPQNGNLIGEIECTLGEIIGSKGQQLIKTIKNKNISAGNIILRCEQLSDNNSNVMMQIAGKELEDNSGFFHSFKPFFYLSRSMESGGNQRVYMSEVLKGRNVVWKLFEKSMKDLCNGDPSRPIVFELYDHHNSGNHDFLASADFSISQITEEGVKQFTLINPKKKTKKNYKHSGIISINTIQIIQNYTLMDYIQGGCQVSLTIAVDFTASNGIPTNPASLHFMNPNGLNQYEQALFAVSEILLNYDSDKQVPMYGFGGKINGVTSHCFNMNFNQSDPNVYGIDGIMQAYRNSLRYVELNGPTLFAHFLSKIVCEIEATNVNQMNQQYNVLLILTDGEIHDQRETINWIVRGSNCPLSIVIVGIGNDGFDNMHELDADDNPLYDSRGNKMLRDIVQFVPFREVGNSPQRLAKEVLAEIPREVANYFKMKNIVPNERIEAPEYDFERSYTIASNPEGNVPVPSGIPAYPQAYVQGYHQTVPPVNPRGYEPMGNQTVPPQRFPPQYSSFVPQAGPAGYPGQGVPKAYENAPTVYQSMPPGQISGYAYVPPN